MPALQPLLRHSRPGSRKYPEILPVDIEGRKRKHGGRVNFCPNSKKYREFSVKLAAKLAQRYKDHPSLQVWHIANEYGTYCYCENCAAEFRNWLKARYGTIEELNRSWNKLPLFLTGTIGGVLNIQVVPAVI